MLDLAFLIVLAGLALLWLVVGFTMRRWGPGVSKHIVRCPETKTLARVGVLYEESDFGSVRAADVVRCSLFGGGPVKCHKDCLTRV